MWGKEAERISHIEREKEDRSERFQLSSVHSSSPGSRGLWFLLEHKHVSLTNVATVYFKDIVLTSLF